MVLSQRPYLVRQPALDLLQNGDALIQAEGRPGRLLGAQLLQGGVHSSQVGGSSGGGRRRGGGSG